MPATVTTSTQRVKTSSVPPSTNIRRLTAHFSNTSLKPPATTNNPTNNNNNRSAIPSFNSSSSGGSGSGGGSNPAIYRHSIHTSSISSI